MSDHIISDDLHAYLVDQGWTPPADVAAMVRDEQHHIGDGGTVLGGADGTGVVMVHVRARGDAVIAVNATAYRHAEEIGEVHDLLSEDLSDVVDTQITPLWDLVSLLGGDQ